MYNKLVQECFFNPQHVGVLDVSQTNTVFFSNAHYTQNAVIELYMQCDEQQIVRSMRFKTNGNPYMIATLESLCKQSVGKNFNQLYFNGEELIKILEIPFKQSPVTLQVQDVFREVISLIRICC
jgi:nitrogen fixation NifU-like protein